MSGSSPGVTDVGLVRMDGAGRCTYVNDRLCGIVGLGRDAILGRAWTEHVPAQLAVRLPELWRELRAGHPVQYVLSHERPDGRRGSIQFEALPEMDSDGRVASVLSVLLDVAGKEESASVAGSMAVPQSVTSLRRAEEAARARLDELESVYRNAPVGLGFVDPDLRYLRVNQAIADMNGVSIEEMVGRTYRELSPANADQAEPFLHRLMQEGAPVRNLEVRARPPSDPETTHVYLLSMQPVRGARDQLVGYTTAVQDVTELHRTRDTAAQRLEELEILYANAPAGLCYVDADLRIVKLNPLFAQLTGQPVEALVGRTAAEILPGDLARRLVPQLRYVARTGTASVDLEIRGALPGSDGRECTWIARVHPVRARPIDPVSGVILVCKDVTAMADRQREIEVVRDRLAEAQRVARVGSWEWNLIEDRVWWSPELYEIFGEDPGRTPSYTRFVEHVHPADRPKVRDQIERTLGDDQPYRMTFRILRGDGAERVVFTAARLERTAGGLAARLVGTCQDVTEFGPFESRPLPARSGRGDPA